MGARTRFDRKVEDGKALILTDVKLILANNDLDVDHVAFRWLADHTARTLTLSVDLPGARCWLRFAEQDVLSWPWLRSRPADDYSSEMRSLLTAAAGGSAA